MKLKFPHLLKPLGTIIQQNYWFFYPSEPFSYDHFNMIHPVNVKRQYSSKGNTPHCICFFCNLSLKFIPHINIWKIWNDLRLFSKYLHVPFLRPLRSKDDRGWILRLRPWNFAIIAESLAANLEMVRQTCVWQTVPKFWFIWLWYLSFCITYKSKSLRNNKKDK